MALPVLAEPQMVERKAEEKLHQLEAVCAIDPVLPRPANPNLML